MSDMFRNTNNQIVIKENYDNNITINVYIEQNS